MLRVQQQDANVLLPRMYLESEFLQKKAIARTGVWAIAYSTRVFTIPKLMAML